ncbi:polysaccharide lyase 8 family protein [Neobacillus rhizophilus]|uniref:Polysaccharide lyase 8 family protein n=1 Tax=Neobacillus rhizophilus TaxID=2833579 RepID=A0A942UGB0_9BACI|nr:polysaccharide lyase 8 family protein [Neobacillus rhizophilus]MBS4216669.1 polysaccharide lyase 8 family protein [Neobacillus rhizophilus]
MRHLLSIVGKTLLAFLVVFATILPFAVKHSSAAEGTSTDFEVLRQKWKSYLVGGNFSLEDPDVASKVNIIAKTAYDYWEPMVKTNPDNYIWEDLDDSVITVEKSKSSPMTLAYQRLNAMAVAYETKGAAIKNSSGETVTLYQNPQLITDIKNGLNWLYQKKYNTNRSIGKTNWFDWCIGTPLALNDTVVLIYDQLTPEERNNYMAVIDKFTPDPTKANGGKATGANLMYVAQVVGIRSIILGDGDKLAASRDAISPLFEYVTTGDGFYKDGSFLQHGNHPYTGGYGKALLANLVSFVYLLDGSDWKVKDPNLDNMYKWIFDSYEPVIYKGGLMDIIRGREISRFNQQDHLMGHETIRPILHLASFAPPQYAARLKSMVKEWIQSDTYLSFYETAPIYHVVLAKQIVNDSTIKPRGELVTNRQFANMDRTVHLRPDFGFALGMSSSRIYNYESINDENLKGWYMGDGATYLYNSDLSQYSDDYWGTVNMYRIPGTTVDTQTRKSSEGQSKASAEDWVGGTNIAGLYGVSGMASNGSKAWKNTLTAKKSWFMFDDEVVALGAGINSTDNRTIETTIENRKIKNDGTNELTVNGVAKSANLGWQESINDVKTIHLQGNTTGSDIGYYFPEPTTINALREARTDKWSNSNLYPKFTDDSDVTRNFVTLWKDHGKNPVNDTYEYVLLPNKTSSQTTDYANNPDIQVLKNSGDVQAVQEKKLNIVAANFWNDNSQPLKVDGKDFISSDKKASVMTMQSGNELEISVSDPTQKNAGTINLEINNPAAFVVSADSGVSISHTYPTIKLSIDVKNAKGKTFKVKLALLSVDSINKLVDDYANSGGVQGALLVQLKENLTQAQDQYSKQHLPQAVKSLQDFQKHINNKGLQDQISGSAKEELSTKVEQLIEYWSQP